MGNLLQEVACLQSRLIDTLHVPQHAGASELFLTQSADVGSGISPASSADADDYVLSWTFSKAKPSELQLTETPVEGQRSCCQLTVAFGSALFPQACFHQSKGLIVLTADGLLHSLASRDHSRHSSMLDALATSSVDLQREVVKLGKPTTLGLITASKPSDGFISIGGQTGSVLVVPAACFDNQSAHGCHELKHTPSSYLGFLSKSVTPAVSWMCSLHSLAPGLLCALHADCSLRFWNAPTRQRMLVENLLQQSGQKGHMVPTAVGSVCSTKGHLRLVVHLEPKTGTMCQPQTVAVSMDLQQALDGTLHAFNMRERMLEHSDLSFNTILTHRDTADAEAAQTWLLSTAPSLHAITSSVSGKPHEESHRTTLIEKQGVDTGSHQQMLQDDIWQSIQQNILDHTGHGLPDDTVAQHYMQQLLAPGDLCQQALSHALLELEEPLSRYNASNEEVLQHLTAAAQGMAAQQKWSELASWRRVVQIYWKHWTELHPAVGLVELPHGDVAIVRSGHMLTLLQQADPLTASHQLTTCSGNGTPQSGDLALLQQCVELLQQLLGQEVVKLFVHLWTEPPADISLHNICCAFIEVLSTGPQLGSLQEQPQAAESRDALRHWRRQRSAAILKLGQLVSQMSAGTPVQALREYMSLFTLEGSQTQAAPMHSATQLSPSAGHALTIMLRQRATQQLQSASHMLLLAWLDSLRAAGALHISAAVSSALKQEITPQLQAHMRSTAIVQWLCTVPAAALLDNEARVKHSELSSKLASLEVVSSARHEMHHQHSLADLFLPDFAAQCGGVSLEQQPHLATSALSSYFQAGCTHSTGPLFLSSSTVVQQVLAVGQKLIELHQVAHMHHLLALAGDGACTPGADFLMGYAGLHQAQRGMSDERSRQAVQATVSHLFRAVAVFHTANQPAHYGQQADLTASCSLVKRVIRDILLHLTGSCDTPDPQGEELQYFEALMLQSEHWGWPQAAASFAQAAMRQVEVVYAQANAPQSDQDRVDWTRQRHSRESMLCTNLFVYALEAGQYEDAYNAVQANPMAQGALGNLQRLVNSLLNTSNIATLCSLPYAADYTVQQPDGRWEVLSLLEATQQLLEQRAATSQLSSQPQLYDMLYDFYCMRSNFKAAAAAQYTLACRLKDEGSHTLQCLHQRADALLQAVTALSMVEPSQQWLLDQAHLHQALRPPMAYTNTDHPSTSNTPTSTTALSRCKAGIARSIVVLSSSSSQAVSSGCQYTDLTKEHAAAHAHALLAGLDADAAHQPTVADDCFHQALQMGLFQLALSLAVVLYQGHRLAQSLRTAVAAMVTGCVQKQMDSSQADTMAMPASELIFGQGPSPQGFSEDEGVRPDFEDLSAAAAWSAVMVTLQQHETPHNKCDLHLAAVRAALAQERRLKLPAALLAPFQAPAPHDSLSGMAGRGPDPAALLSIYLQYRRLTDAADLVLDHLTAYQKADVTSRQGHCQVWFPFRVISSLMMQLRKTPNLHDKHRQLQEALQKHQQNAINMSHMLQSKLSDDAAVMEE